MVKETLGKICLLPLTLLGWIYALAPGPFREFMASVIGWVPQFLRFRESVSLQNLERAFPGESLPRHGDRKRVLKNFYRHLGHLFFEVCMVIGPFSAMRFFAKRFVEIEGYENWKKASQKGRGVIFTGGHLGSWEVMAAGGTLRGIDAMLVTKRLKPAFLHDWIEKGRKKCGVKAAYEPKTLSTVLTHLKNGGTVGFVVDQYAGPPIGVRVPLFGIPVGTANIAAALAKRTGAPVLPIMNARKPGGGFVIRIRPPLSEFDAGAEGERDRATPRELAEATARYVSILERDILLYPEQWLWTHRRFKGDLGPIGPEEWDQGRLRK